MTTDELQETTNSVRKFVREVLWQNSEADAMDEFRDFNKVQINIRMHSYQAFHLEHLAQHLRMSRADLALQLLESALSDAWDEAGLPEVVHDDGLKQQLSAYMDEHRK